MDYLSVMLRALIYRSSSQPQTPTWSLDKIQKFGEPCYIHSVTGKLHLLNKKDSPRVAMSMEEAVYMVLIIQEYDIIYIDLLA